jgi:hypothetical protein
MVWAWTREVRRERMASTRMSNEDKGRMLCVGMRDEGWILGELDAQTHS